MRTVVIGSAGQLGRDLVSSLAGEVVPLTRDDADLTDGARLCAVLETHRPDQVINCAADNFVDRAESDPESAFAVNAWAVRTLALICRDLDIVLVHFSTDYVFGMDRCRQAPWKEGDAPGPVNAYGLSKLTGECWLRMLSPKHLVIRTCGLYGTWVLGGKGGNFVETMLRLGARGKPIRVVDDQRCTPSYTRDVALGAVELLTLGKRGLFHLTNSGDCSWFDFAAEIFRQSGMNVDLAPIASASDGAPAPRPCYSVLDNKHSIAEGAKPLRPWQEALAAYLAERSQRPNAASA